MRTVPAAPARPHLVRAGLRLRLSVRVRFRLRLRLRVRVRVFGCQVYG